MKKIFLLLTAISILMLSCGNDTDTPDTGQKTGKGIRFSSSIGSNNLKSTDSWKAGDEIFIYMTAAKIPMGSDVSEYFKYNQTPATYVTLNGDGMFTPKTAEDELFFPENGDAVNFVAYAPYAPFDEHPRPLNSNPFYLPMKNGVPQPGQICVALFYQEDQSKLDVIIAKDLTNRTKDEGNVVQLEFEHTMSKLEFNISTEGDLTDNDLVGLKVYSYGSLYDGINYFGLDSVKESTAGWWMSRGENKNVYFKVSADGKFSESTLLPEGNLVNKKDLKITFELANGEKYIWSYNTEILLKGVKRKYNIILRKKGSEKVALQLGQTTITDWQNTPIEDVILE